MLPSATEGRLAIKLLGSGRTTCVAVTLAGSTLSIEYDAKGKEELVPLSPTHFSWSGTVVEFSTTAGGAVNMLVRYVEGDEHGPRHN